MPKTKVISINNNSDMMAETLKNNIFAVSSGFVKAGVTVIRLSGPDVLNVVKILGVKSAIKPRYAHLRKFYNPENNQIIDEGLLIYFPSPNSFTGEDVVELQIHGSYATVNEMLQVLGNIKGFRQAEAGEFSRRAFENGCMDLVQIEGLADLIDAETKLQAKQALKLTQGDASRKYDDWRSQMIEIQGFIEAFIDFPDEDIPQEIEQQFLNKSENLITELNTHLSNNIGERIRNGVVITILGKPNVGKSSLMNLLSRRDVAIVSDIAGTTRDTLETHLDIEGYAVTLIDTAGIRESNDLIETEGVKRALQKAENADLKIIMLDASEHTEDNSADILKMVDERTIIILNKIDKAPDIQKDIVINGIKALQISIERDQNIDVLKNKISEQVKDIFKSNNISMPLTHARHRIQLEESIQHLHNFIDARKAKLAIELCAEEIRFAANSLGKITGKIDVEDLLDKIFSSFCIGK